MEWVSWLEDWASELETLQNPGRFKQSRTVGGVAFKAQTLLSCWQLSLQIRSLHGLKDAVAKSIMVALPGPLADAVLSAAPCQDDEGSPALKSLPSAWTLQRAKARIDVAFMLFMARQNSLPGALSILHGDTQRFPSWAAWVCKDPTPELKCCYLLFGPERLSLAGSSGCLCTCEAGVSWSAKV